MYNPVLIRLATIKSLLFSTGLLDHKGTHKTKVTYDFISRSIQMSLVFSGDKGKLRATIVPVYALKMTMEVCLKALGKSAKLVISLFWILISIFQYCTVRVAKHAARACLATRTVQYLGNNN